jgi:RNA polymerase sigma-70 factor (ECF subfamily)
MADPPVTRPSLLVRIRDAGDAEAWQEFVKLYAPLVYGFARKRGLQDADAADLTQEVLRSVSKAAARLEYDPRRGTFRGWLFTVVRNKIHDFQASQQRRPPVIGSMSTQTRLEKLAAPAEDETALWHQEYERQLLTRALEQVRGDFHDSTWQAFWRTAIQGTKAKEAAEALGMSTAAVYVAKSRVLAQLKKLMEQLREND